MSEPPAESAEPAFAFYSSLGVKLLDEWAVRRLSAQRLTALAARAPAVVQHPSGS